MLEKINYKVWSKPLLHKTIDVLWTATIIWMVIILWKQGSSFLKGISITLFFIVLMNYLKETKEVLVNQSKKP